MRIIGVDPGTLRTGFGIIDWQQERNSTDYITCGTIQLPGGEHIARRLRRLKSDLEQVIDRYAPECLGLETAFFGLNVQSAMKIGEARAVIMLTAAEYDMPVIELAPATVKKTVTGSGRASKEQVQKMVTLLLALNTAPTSEDAADALAVAIATSHEIRKHPLK